MCSGKAVQEISPGIAALQWSLPLIISKIPTLRICGQSLSYKKPPRMGKYHDLCGTPESLTKHRVSLLPEYREAETININELKTTQQATKITGAMIC
ncbi:hypothetical protein TcWFU_006818 [Taenia crassiceps]|uniref:Uncharacterized protein n=1 Tax=Taenia crassiceps TaxID=6207 RepID=A0ABR4QS72_9CEST